MAGTLIMCATPIGNLGDVSHRLAEALRSADLVYAEDTRRTGILLTHLGISVPMVSFFAGNERMRLDELRDALTDGSTVALVTDAGTPTVSDPGSSAVDVAARVGATITVIPGPSAVTAALAVSGFPGDRFVFWGFLARSGRTRSRELDEIARDRRTAVVFCAPSRVDRDLADLARVVDANRRIVVVRELTKLHEEAWRGTIADAADEFSAPERRRGEFTLVLDGAAEPVPDMGAAVEFALALIAEGASPSDAVREAAEAEGVRRRDLYERVMRAKR